MTWYVRMGTGSVPGVPPESADELFEPPLEPGEEEPPHAAANKARHRQIKMARVLSTAAAMSHLNPSKPQWQSCAFSGARRWRNPFANRRRLAQTLRDQSHAAIAVRKQPMLWQEVLGRRPACQAVGTQHAGIAKPRMAHLEPGTHSKGHFPKNACDICAV